jgi:hypothetical protein
MSQTLSEKRGRQKNVMWHHPNCRSKIKFVEALIHALEQASICKLLLDWPQNEICKCVLSNLEYSISSKKFAIYLMYILGHTIT